MPNIEMQDETTPTPEENSSNQNSTMTYILKKIMNAADSIIPGFMTYAAVKGVTTTIYNKFYDEGAQQGMTDGVTGAVNEKICDAIKGFYEMHDFLLPLSAYKPGFIAGAAGITATATIEIASRFAKEAGKTNDPKYYFAVLVTLLMGAGFTALEINSMLPDSKDFAETVGYMDGYCKTKGENVGGPCNSYISCDDGLDESAQSQNEYGFQKSSFASSGTVKLATSVGIVLGVNKIFRSFFVGRSEAAATTVQTDPETQPMLPQNTRRVNYN